MGMSQHMAWQSAMRRALTHALAAQTTCMRHKSTWLGWLGFGQRDNARPALCGPQAHARPVTRQRPGLMVTDEYSWMEEGGDQLTNHLASEARHCQAELQWLGVVDMAAALRKEAQQRRAHTARLARGNPLAPGERIGDWVYSSSSSSSTSTTGISSTSTTVGVNSSSTTSTTSTTSGADSSNSSTSTISTDTSGSSGTTSTTSTTSSDSTNSGSCGNTTTTTSGSSSNSTSTSATSNSTTTTTGNSSSNSSDSTTAATSSISSSYEAAGVMLSRQRVMGTQPCGSHGSVQEQSHGAHDSRSQVVLDEARLAEAVEAAEKLTGASLVPAVVSLKLSPCHRFLAVTVPLVVPGSTSDVAAALLLNCDTGQLLPGGVLLQVSSVEWMASSTALLATRPDQAGRPWQVWLYPLPHAAATRSPASPPQLLLSSPDPAVYLELGRTKDGRYILVNANSKTSSQVHLLDAAWVSPQPPTLRCVQPHRPGLEYFVEHYANHLLILTNHQPTNHQPPTRHSFSSSPAWTTAAQKAGLRGRIELLHPAQPLTGPCVAWGRGMQDASCHVPAAAAEYHVMHVPCDSASWGADAWRLLPGLSLPAGATITDLDIFDGWCALHGRLHALPAVWVVRMASQPGLPSSNVHGTVIEQGAAHGAVHRTNHAAVPEAAHADMPPTLSAVSCTRVPLPSWVTHITPGVNAHPPSRTLQLLASSPAHPPHTFEYDVDSGKLKLLHVEHVAGRHMGQNAWAVHPKGRPWPMANPYSSPQFKPPAQQKATVQPDNQQAKGVPHATIEHATQPAAHASNAGFGKQARGAEPVSQASYAEPEAQAWGTHCPDDYVVARMWVPVAAGAVEGAAQQQHLLMPITMAGHKDCFVQHDGTVRAAGHAPVLLIGYGAYGQSLSTAWDVNMAGLMERGVIVCWAHVRGGGELGRGWAAAGRQESKVQSQADYQAAVVALVEGGVARPGMIAAYGYSAGGLLVGAALASPLTRALLSSALLHLAFLDLSSCMARPDLPLTAHEADEWGDPCDPCAVAAMHAVCPYQQLGVLLGQGPVVTAADPAAAAAGSPADTGTGWAAGAGSATAAAGRGLAAAAGAAGGPAVAAAAAAGRGLAAAGDGGPAAGAAAGVAGGPAAAAGVAAAAFGRGVAAAGKGAAAAAAAGGLAAAPLPPILASSAVLDARVPCWVPAKWVARARSLQARHAGSAAHQPVLLRVLWERGHHADPDEAEGDTALEHAFIMQAWRARWQREEEGEREQRGQGQQ